MPIRDLSNGEVKDFFLRNPAICYIGLPDEDLVYLYENKDFVLRENELVIGYFEKEELICLVRYTYFTSICINFHMYIDAKYHHTGKASQIQNEFRKYYSERNIKKVMVMAPETCKHVIKFAEKNGMIFEGRLTRSLMWRNEIVDIMLYGLELE